MKSLLKNINTFLGQIKKGNDWLGFAIADSSVALMWSEKIKEQQRNFQLSYIHRAVLGAGAKALA